MKIIRTTDPPLYIHEAGDGQRSILIITDKASLPNFDLTDKATVLIDPDVAEVFRGWVRDQLVGDSAKELGVSKARVGRIRQGLGVTKYTKSGTSRTTLWRREKDK